ncbi:12301_t:CDS:2, partial [Gigaspora rosea]
QFPSIELVQGECRRCNKEKGTPKKFSAENNMDSDVQEFATHLPHHPSSLDMLIVRRNSSDRSAFRGFQVRRDKVSRALHWLKENNVFYRDIEIANDILQSLLENDTIIDQLSEASNNQELYNGQADNLDVNENEDSEDFITRTFVPVLPPRCSENNAINNALNHIQHSQLQYNYPIIDWPHIESMPIDKFQT